MIIWIEFHCGICTLGWGNPFAAFKCHKACKAKLKAANSCPGHDYTQITGSAGDPLMKCRECGDAMSYFDWRDKYLAIEEVEPLETG